MRISVIITTYQSPHWLEKVLWGYIHQTFQNFELIIADDGSDKKTAQLIQNYTNKGIKIEHIWQPDKGFRKTRILNKAILAAKGNYLVFTDGDLIPRSDFLYAHHSHAKVGRFLSGGCIRLPLNTSHTITVNDVVSERAFSVRWLQSNGARIKSMTKLLVPYWASTFADKITTTRSTWNGGNASGWKQDIISINGFDERMEYGGEDRELGERLENAGIHGIQIRHRAICIHLDHPRSYICKNAIKRNIEIRKTTKTKKIIRTEYGIKKNFSDSQ